MICFSDLSKKNQIAICNKNIKIALETKNKEMLYFWAKTKENILKNEFETLFWQEI